MVSKKIGFIGCGNMGSAILAGMLSTEEFKKDQMMVYHRRAEAAQALQSKYGISLAKDYQDLMNHCDVIILGIKPNGFEPLIRACRQFLRPDHLIISIAAGNSISQIEEWFDTEVKLVRIMPNTPVMVGLGMSAIMPNQYANDEDVAFVKQMCGSFGRFEVVSEDLIDAITGVSGSSPAYVYMFIEALADGAVREGMKRDQAYEFAAQAVMGAAKMVLETGIHPGALKDAVCSPGGTTIEAVAKLEELGFRHSVMRAVQACAAKSRNMKK